CWAAVRGCARGGCRPPAAPAPRRPARRKRCAASGHCAACSFSGRTPTRPPAPRIPAPGRAPSAGRRAWTSCERRERLPQRFAEAREVRTGVRQGQKAALVGGGREVHAALEHGVEQPGETLGFALREGGGGARRARLVQRYPEERT